MYTLISREILRDKRTYQEIPRHLGRLSKAKEWAQHQPLAKIIETVLYAGFVALVVSVVPLFVGCHELQQHAHGEHAGNRFQEVWAKLGIASKPIVS